MAIIIGAGTTVTFGSACVVSASWGYNSNTQRLYCLGSWSPTLAFSRPVETLNLVAYSGGTPTYSTQASTSCANANTISATVNPAGCGGSVGSVTGSWFVTSYSFSKDDTQLPGQESWSLQKWVGDNTPTYVIRGITEGQATSEDVGIQFTGALTYSTTGNVSAGGIGRYDTLMIGAVIQVGGSASLTGEVAQGSASIPYTPLYI